MFHCLWLCGDQTVFILGGKNVQMRFFFFFFWIERHYSTPSCLSTLCILPPSKAAENTGNSSNCLYMRLCKPYSKTAGFLGFSTFHFCSFRPLQKPIFLCMSLGLVFPFSEYGLWVWIFFNSSTN